MPIRGWRRVFRLETGPRRVERDVNEEIAFHIEMRTRRLIESGVHPDAARATALAQFGDLPSVRDECLSIGRERERAMKFSDLLSNLRQDAEYAVRSLRKQPGFTIVVLLILAIGIGANTATFTLIDALMLRALPVPHPEQLVTIGDPSQTQSNATGTPATVYVSYPVYADVRDKTTAFSGVYATGATGTLDVRDASAPADSPAAHPRARFVSGNFFSVLQVPARIGRTFSTTEDRTPGDDPVVVISDAYWKRDFGGSESIAGHRVSINGVLMTVIGVMPPSFSGDIVGSSTDLWIPLMMLPQVAPYHQWLDDRSASWLLLMGRLAPGATIAKARSEATAVELHSILDHATPDAKKIVESNLKGDPIRVEPGARGFSHYRSAYARDQRAHGARRRATAAGAAAAHRMPGAGRGGGRARTRRCHMVHSPLAARGKRRIDTHSARRASRRTHDGIHRGDLVGDDDDLRHRARRALNALGGRSGKFGLGDRAGSVRAAMINETAARFYFGDSNPVGRTLTRSDSVYTIVGVVRDVEKQSVRAKPVRRVYFPVLQEIASLGVDLRLEVRASGDPALLVKPIREAVLAADRTLSPNVETVNSLVRQSTGQDWLVMQIISFFGALTLVLAALGLYGLMAYATARRTGEFGIRAALGAAPGAVTRMILGEALSLTAIGLAIGLPAGLVAARLIRGQLFGVSMIDLPSLVGAAVVLAGAAALASYLPARRAARVGPLEALRAD